MALVLLNYEFSYGSNYKHFWQVFFLNAKSRMCDVTHRVHLSSGLLTLSTGRTQCPHHCGSSWFWQRTGPRPRESHSCSLRSGLRSRAHCHPPSSSSLNILPYRTLLLRLSDGTRRRHKLSHTLHTCPT